MLFKNTLKKLSGSLKRVNKKFTKMLHEVQPIIRIGLYCDSKYCKFNCIFPDHHRYKKQKTLYEGGCLNDTEYKEYKTFFQNLCVTQYIQRIKHEKKRREQLNDEIISKPMDYWNNLITKERQDIANSNWFYGRTYGIFIKTPGSIEQKINQWKHYKETEIRISDLIYDENYEHIYNYNKINDDFFVSESVIKQRNEERQKKQQQRDEWLELSILEKQKQKEREEQKQKELQKELQKQKELAAKELEEQQKQEALQQLKIIKKVDTFQATIGLNHEIRLLYYNDPYDFSLYPMYSLEMEHRRTRNLFYLRIHNILINYPFNIPGLLFQKSFICSYPNVSLMIRGGSSYESHNETINRIILGFENKQNLPKVGQTPVWIDNIYYKMDDLELKNYFINLFDIQEI